jgi:hypothetical protein
VIGGESTNENQLSLLWLGMNGKSIVLSSDDDLGGMLIGNLGGVRLTSTTLAFLGVSIVAQA